MRIMKMEKLLLAALCFPLFFLSCKSTNVYVKESVQFYENNMLQEETETLTKDSRLQSKKEIIYDKAQIDGYQVYARTESQNGGSGKMHVQVFNGEGLYAEKDFTVSGKKFSPAGGFGEKSKTLARAAGKVVENQAAKGSEEAAGSQTRLLAVTEQVQVDSSTNRSFVTYTILGKPFVILGATSWNLLKCAGFAFVNFLGGYNTVVNGDFFWLMPDVKKAKTKAAQARAANGISVYPEYHKAFTNNTITVNETTAEAVNEFALSSGDVKVLSKESFSYTNKLSVKRSAIADANATTAVIGLVGTIITVPVSVITWIGGAAAGIYVEAQN